MVEEIEAQKRTQNISLIEAWHVTQSLTNVVEKKFSNLSSVLNAVFRATPNKTKNINISKKKSIATHV